MMEPIKTYTTGKVDTNDGEFNCDNQGLILKIVFENTGATGSSIEILAGNARRTLERTVSNREQVTFGPLTFPYVDTTLYKYNFSGTKPWKINITVTKILEDGKR